jgi:hypothetical protein
MISVPSLRLHGDKPGFHQFREVAARGLWRDAGDEGKLACRPRLPVKQRDEDCSPRSVAQQRSYGRELNR